MQVSFAEYFSDLFELFYPDVCLSCSEKLLKGEQVICFKCLNELPKTDHWNDIENPMARRFWGRVALQGAGALFQFQKGEHVQHLLHQLKYRNRQDVGEYLGKMLGLMLLQPDPVIKNVDLIVPVPLHWKKQRKRGYNQCDPIAKGISETINIPWSDSALERALENISQTKKNRFDRWANVAEIFAVKDSAQLRGKHILLVDDVMTTGATAEACLQTILSVENTKASFVSIAVALR
jgi:ComF family protein